MEEKLYHRGSGDKCSECGSLLRVTVSTAVDEDDNMNLIRHEKQVEDYNQYIRKCSSATSSSQLHIVVGVGATNSDSLLQEVLLHQQKSCPSNMKHTSLWMNTESAPTSLMNCNSMCGNILEVLPLFLEHWLDALVKTNNHVMTGELLSAAENAKIQCGNKRKAGSDKMEKNKRSSV